MQRGRSVYKKKNKGRRRKKLKRKAKMRWTKQENVEGVEKPNDEAETISTDDDKPKAQIL